jgi:hypothetical protein
MYLCCGFQSKAINSCFCLNLFGELLFLLDNILIELPAQWLRLTGNTCYAAPPAYQSLVPKRGCLKPRQVRLERRDNLRGWRARASQAGSCNHHPPRNVVLVTGLLSW